MAFTAISMGSGTWAVLAMVRVSVTDVRRTPRRSSPARSAACCGVSWAKTRREMSPAIKVRAWLSRRWWKARLKDRTPVSAPTPTATARITKRNLAGEERKSRQAILRGAGGWGLGTGGLVLIQCGHRATGCGGLQRLPTLDRASPAPAWCLPDD